MLLYGLISICILIYFFLKIKHSYWKNRGIAQNDPVFLFGNLKDAVFKRISVNQAVEKSYYNFKKKGVKHGGIYLFYTPVWMPIDVALVKRIMTKDYEYFGSHGFFHHEKDSISLHLFNVEGQRWKDLRTKLTPTFTSGKLKIMYDILDALGDRMDDKIADYCQRAEPIEMKEFAARFGTDVVATCFFGIECDSLNEPDNGFRKHGKVIFEPRPFNLILENFFNWEFLAYLGYTFSPKQVTDFFSQLVKETIDYREKNNVSRNDYLNLLIQLKNKGTLDENEGVPNNGTGFLNFEEVVANMFMMYAAGFETSSTTITFLMYELAKNQDVQEKLREEIVNISKNRANGDITYDDLMEMKYADSCIMETLRRYTPVPEVPRRCTKTYHVPDTDVVIQKGTFIMLPAWAIHNDPEHYLNPDKFNPDRFSDQTKNSELPFFAFGGGPRLCIGFRFAQMQIKIALIKCLKNFKYTLNSNTPDTLKYQTVALTLTSKEDILLDVTRVN